MSTKPTFEQYIAALCDGGIIYRNVCDELAIGKHGDDTCEPELKLAYVRLYGEQPDLKPKPKISDIVDICNEAAIAIRIAMRDRKSMDRVAADATAMMKLRFNHIGLAHLIDWEDES